MKLFSASIMLTALFFTFNAKAQTEIDSLSTVKIDTISIKIHPLKKGKNTS